jgi:transcriptional regulator with XRE-family HTH domain
MKLQAFEIVSEGGFRLQYASDGTFTIKGLTPQQALACGEWLSTGLPAASQYRIAPATLGDLTRQFKAQVARVQGEGAPGVLQPTLAEQLRTKNDDVARYAALSAEDIAPRMRELRERRGLTRPQVCAAARVSVSYLASIERAQAKPRLDKLLALLTVLDCSLDDFFEAEEEPEVEAKVEVPEPKRTRKPKAAPVEVQVSAPPVLEPEPAPESEPAVQSAPDDTMPWDPEVKAEPEPAPADSREGERTRVPEVLRQWLNGGATSPPFPSSAEWAVPAVIPKDVPFKWDRASIRVHPVFGESAVIQVVTTPNGKTQVGGSFYDCVPEIPAAPEGWHEGEFDAWVHEQGRHTMLPLPPMPAGSVYSPGYMAASKNLLQGICYAIHTGARTPKKYLDLMTRLINDKVGVFSNYGQKLTYDGPQLREVLLFLAELVTIGHEEAWKLTPGTFAPRRHGMHVLVWAHTFLLRPESVRWPGDQPALPEVAS